MQNNEGKSKIRKFIDDNIGEENINKAKIDGYNENGTSLFVLKPIEIRKR